MQNILTLYRFNTPFLDIENEKQLLIWIKNKLKGFLNIQWLNINETKEIAWEYHNIFFLSQNILKIRFQYISKFSWNYYMPIFKMDIYLDSQLLLEKNLKKTTLFLTSLLENFDWLNEKEYLIDISNKIYYKTWLFSAKFYPEYDFQEIDKIKKIFESKDWNKLLQEFILKFKDTNFILTKENSDIFHKIHSIILYYIYLVYIMYKSMINTEKTLWNLEKLEYNDHNEHIDLMTERLKYVNDLSIANFNNYYEKLEIFFKLFK